MFGTTRALAFAGLVLLLAACAGRTADPVAVLQPQDRYMDCAAINAEARSNASRIEVVAAEIRKREAQNTMASTASAVLSPIFLLAYDFRDAGGKEATALLSRQRHLLTLADQRCAGNIPLALQNLPPTPADRNPPGPQPTAAAAPAPTATVRELECSDPDGARFRATGTACPTPSSPPAGAQVTGRRGRCPDTGMQFRFSDTKDYLVSVQDLGNQICRYRNSQTGRYFDRILMLGMHVEVVKENVDSIRSIFPLEIGKRASFGHSGGRWHYDLSVEKQEEVVTAAGRFPAFVLAYREQVLSSPPTVVDRRWWYAPSLGIAVKFEYSIVQGAPPNPSKNWELVEIQAP